MHRGDPPPFFPSVQPAFHHCLVWPWRFFFAFSLRIPFGSGLCLLLEQRVEEACGPIIAGRMVAGFYYSFSRFFPLLPLGAVRLWPVRPRTHQSFQDPEHSLETEQEADSMTA